MGQNSLRRGRYSSPGSTYFLTFCTEHRAVGLDKLYALLHGQALTLESQNVWVVHSQVVMPDHEHLIVILHEDADLPAAVRLYRGRTSVALRTAGLRWQRGYFDHCLRPDEDRLPVFLYLYLNPYRADLLPVSAKWDGYYCRAEDWAWFSPLTNEGCPMPEWLA